MIKFFLLHNKKAANVLHTRQDLYIKHQETANVEYIEIHSITRLTTHSQDFDIPGPRQGFKQNPVSSLCLTEQACFLLSTEEYSGWNTTVRLCTYKDWCYHWSHTILFPPRQLSDQGKIWGASGVVKVFTIKKLQLPPFCNRILTYASPKFGEHTKSCLIFVKIQITMM